MRLFPEDSIGGIGGISDASGVNAPAASEGVAEAETAVETAVETEA
jgi:hypothetical protein